MKRPFPLYPFTHKTQIMENTREKREKKINKINGRLSFTEFINHVV